MTRYKLADALGGGEYESQGPAYGPHGMAAQRFHLPGFPGAIDIPESMLKKVEPPFPPEPHPGAYQIGEAIILRFARNAGDNDLWYWSIVDSYGDCGWLSWKALWRKFGREDAAAVPLVPATGGAS